MRCCPECAERTVLDTGYCFGRCQQVTLDSYQAPERVYLPGVNGRVGDWFQTFSGVQFFPMDPRPEDFKIEDIAHALARICRFGGHTREFYSVAQHSLFVSRYCPPEFAMIGLLHDAPEAYIGDMVKPFKKSMPAFQEVEDRIWRVMSSVFRLPLRIPDEVKAIDILALATERRDLLPRYCHQWEPELEQIKPHPLELTPRNTERAERGFLERFDDLLARNTFDNQDDL